MNNIKINFKSTYTLLLVSFFLFLSSCKPEIKGDPKRFKYGTFEIPAGDKFDKETIIRKDSIQISKYGNQIDTLSIRWKNNFFYTLKYINPKNDLQKDPMFIQITKVTDTSYSFTAKIGYSNFKQKGIAYKIK